ncbi:MAG: hypothetical protein EPO01_20280 [Aquabacterium sp.]|jgi:hypothetical protein|nr:MAG: hypothetical protein EPO12_19775 [Aquabacterium sp.]TAL13877.1 MAG: hypothetical protein EPO01_20280 [Aquabacterium sp.]
MFGMRSLARWWPMSLSMRFLPWSRRAVRSARKPPPGPTTVQVDYIPRSEAFPEDLDPPPKVQSFSHWGMH